MANYVVQPLNMLLAIVAFVCNTLICITVPRTESLQRPSLLMLCSLSVTDLIQGLFALYMSIKTVLSEHMCISYIDIKEYAMAILSSLATLGAPVVISRDRYLAVTKPWWYRNHVSKSRAIKMSCIAWTISIIITLAHVFNGGYKHLVHAIPLVYYCICFIIIILSNLAWYILKENSNSRDKRHTGGIKEGKEINCHYKIDPAGTVVNVPASSYVPYSFNGKWSRTFWTFSAVHVFPLYCGCICESFVELWSQ